MALEITCRPIPARQALIHFAPPSKPVYLCCNPPLSRPIRSTTELQTALKRQHGEALLVIPQQHIPADIREVIEAAQQIGNATFRNQANPYLTDLETLCPYVGFTTYLAIDAPGMLVPKASLAAEINTSLDPEIARQSPFYDPEGTFSHLPSELHGRFVVLCTRQNGLPLNRSELAITLAHELGTLRLLSQLEEVDWDRDELPKEGYEFFIYAYSYSFITLLSMAFENDPALGITISGALRLLSKTFFTKMEDNFLALSQGDRRKFLLTSPHVQLTHGSPVFVNLNPTKQTIGPVRPT